MARVNEGLSKAYEEKDNMVAANDNLMAFYMNFPQLVPYSDLTMKFNLKVANNTLTPEQEQIIEELKSCNIEWVENDLNWPTLKINMTKKDKKHLIDYQVDIANDIKFEGRLELKNLEHPGQLIAFRAFGIDLE
ncbi:MAG: hypothetical protein KDD05_04535 [Psychroserpens sp.]|nr:hypothetical protein [Psychroserpens sp.]